MRLLGTITSPYVRKVRILATAAGVPLEIVDSSTPAGQAMLLEGSPLGKVPALFTDGAAGLPAVLPDSGHIAAWLWQTRTDRLRAAGFDLDPGDFTDRALTAQIEGTLDAAIFGFYMKRDAIERKGYVIKQEERLARMLGWLDSRVSWTTPVKLSGLSLACALDWGAFRSTIQITGHAGLERFRAAWHASAVGAGTEPR